MADEDDDGLSEKAALNTQPDDEDSAEDDEFLANLEELPDTDELEEDDLQGDDSDEQPYEAELDVLHLGADGCSVASGPAAEAPSSSRAEERSRHKRRKLSADTPVSTEQPTSTAGHKQQRHQSAAAYKTLVYDKSLRTSVSVSPQQLRHAAALPPQNHGVLNQLHTQQFAQQAVQPSASPLQQQYPQFPRQTSQQSRQRHNQPNHQEMPKQHHLAKQKHHHHQQQQQQQQPAWPSTRATVPLVLNQSVSAHQTTSAVTAASVSANPDDVEDGDDAICLRTRSKHPLASEEFDPDLFDRLLAEFDPDVEPLIDDAMYQQFLQSLQTEAPPGQTDPVGYASHITPAAASSAAAAAAALQPLGTSTAVAGAGLTSAPAAVAAAMAAFADDEDDDDEFQLDPLDWLVDDERDAEEEERLAQLVHVTQTAGAAAGSVKGVQTRTAAAAAGQATASRQPSGLHNKAITGHPEGSVAVGDRRRTQREAARKAAERIALEQQQQQIMLLQQKQVGLITAGVSGYVQPMIPAAAAGWPLSAAAVDHPGAAVPLPLQPQQMLPTTTPRTATAAGGLVSFPSSTAHPTIDQAGMVDPHQQQQLTPIAVPGSVDSVPLPQILTLTDQQLKQLYHQISLHTQLLTQLYVLTARDPGEAAQAVASAAGQMLGTIRRLHAAATGSYRGGQVAELLQQAFFQGSGADQDLDDHDGFVVSNDDQNVGDVRGRGQLARRAYGSRGNGAAAAAWVPAIKDMSSLWDTYPLRLLDDIVCQLRVTPMSEQPLMEQLQQQEAGGSRKNSGNSSRASQQAAREIKMVLVNVLGAVVHGSPEAARGYEQSAWPVISPRGRSGVWGTAEDDLMWLGLVRFHTGVRTLQDTATIISQELLPAKTPTTITTRYRNLVNRKDTTAKQVLKYALMGRERPAAWEDDQDQDGDNSDGDHPLQGEQDLDQGAAAGGGQAPAAKVSRGPMWAAGELGAALTAAFAVAELGVPSAAAAAAAGVLMGDTTAAAADVLGSSSPAGVSAGEQLLRELVSGISSRLPFRLPASLEVPTASSFRRGRRYSSMSHEVDPAAGQQLLLSLAARQILQGDTGEPAAAAAAAGVDRPSQGGGNDEVAAAAAGDGAHGLLAGLFAAGGTDATQQQQQQQLDNVVRLASKPRLGPFTALLQQSPASAANTRQPDAAAAAAHGAARELAVLIGSPSAAAANAAVDIAISTGQPEIQQAAATKDNKGRSTRSQQQQTAEKVSAAADAVTSAAEDVIQLDVGDQQQQKQRREQLSPAAVPNVNSPLYVDTDDEDMDFEKSAAKGKQPRRQLQGEQSQVVQQQQLQVPCAQADVSTAAVVAAYAAATAAENHDLKPSAGAAEAVDAGGSTLAGAGKQLRRKLFGSKKTEAAATAAAPPAAPPSLESTASEAAAVSLLGDPHSHGSPHAAPKEAKAATVKGQRVRTAAAGSQAQSDAGQSAARNQQQHHQPKLHSPPSNRLSSSKGNSKALNIAALPPLSGISVFSASAAGASIGLPASSLAVQLPTDAGCVGIGLGADGWLLHQSTRAAVAVDSLIAGRQQPDNVTRKGKQRQQQQQQRPATSTTPVTAVSSPGRLLFSSNSISNLTTAVQGEAAVAAAAAVTNSMPVKESITARAARRLAEVEAQEAAVAGSAAAAQHQGPKSAGQRKGRRRAGKGVTDNNNTSLTSSPAAAAAAAGAALSGSALTTALGVMVAFSGKDVTKTAAPFAPVGVTGTELPGGTLVLSPPAADGAASQDLTMFRSLLETCQSMLQQQTSAENAHLEPAQLPQLPQLSAQQQVAGSCPGLNDMQVLAGVLQQSMGGGSSSLGGSRLDSAAVYAALGGCQHLLQQQPAVEQQQQQDILQLVQQLVSHQQQLPSHYEGSKAQWSVGTQQQHSSQQHQRHLRAQQIDTGIDTANFSALQALAEAAAKAAARVRR